MRVNSVVLKMALCQPHFLHGCFRKEGPNVLLDRKYGLSFPEEKFDYMRADGKNRKNALIIDIHGGGYISGTRKGNHEFARFFLSQGYDVFLPDYPMVNSRKRISIEQQVQALLEALGYISANIEELGLLGERIYLCGDSAGGQYALLLAELLQSAEMQKSFRAPRIRLDIHGVLLNCPVYDFEEVASFPGLSKASKKLLFGADFQDENRNRRLSPRSYIDVNRIPIFCSSSSKDFLHSQFEHLQTDAQNYTFLFRYDFIQSQNSKAGHIHNIVHMKTKESMEVNKEMLRFLKDTRL